MDVDDRINNEAYFQMRFTSHRDANQNVIEIFATIPRDKEEITLDDVVVHSAGIVGDLHVTADDIEPDELDKMRETTLKTFKIARSQGFENFDWSDS